MRRRIIQEDSRKALPISENSNQVCRVCSVPDIASRDDRPEIIEKLPLQTDGMFIASNTYAPQKIWIPCKEAAPTVSLQAWSCLNRKWRISIDPGLV